MRGRDPLAILISSTMGDTTSVLSHLHAPSLEDMGLGIKAYTLILSIIAAIVSTKKLIHLWHTRHLRRVWGIKNGDRVVVVCSELDDAVNRQQVEPREFIYSLKYGDVDAYLEVLVTLLRLYPKLRLKIMSSGEAESTRLDLASHIVVIGGPDYNAMAERIMRWDQTQFSYRSPDTDTKPECEPEEIVLFDKAKKKEYCHKVDTHDYGYFERIPNRHDPSKHIVLIGGCHTIGVAGAAKAFSMGDSEHGEIPKAVLDNASLVSKKVGKSKKFSVLFEIERLGQTIAVPLVEKANITVTES